MHIFHVDICAQAALSKVYACMQILYNIHTYMPLLCMYMINDQCINKCIRVSICVHAHAYTRSYTSTLVTTLLALILGTSSKRVSQLDAKTYIGSHLYTRAGLQMGAERKKETKRHRDTESDNVFMLRVSVCVHVHTCV
jgi:hypothetical protein